MRKRSQDRKRSGRGTKVLNNSDSKRIKRFYPRRLNPEVCAAGGSPAGGSKHRRAALADGTDTPQGAQSAPRSLSGPRPRLSLLPEPC